MAGREPSTVSRPRSSPPKPAPPDTVEGFLPIWSADARVLVLGSMPGVASLDAAEYYAHPRNAFWAVIEACIGVPRASSYADRTAALVTAGIAVWDVARRCRRVGSLDAAMRDVEPNDLDGLVRRSPHLRAVLCNGQKAHALLRRHARLRERPGLTIGVLPSTSPANAGTSLAAKLAAWRCALVAAGIVTCPQP